MEMVFLSPQFKLAMRFLFFIKSANEIVLDKSDIGIAFQCHGHHTRNSFYLFRRSFCSAGYFLRNMRIFYIFYWIGLGNLDNAPLRKNREGHFGSVESHKKADRARPVWICAKSDVVRSFDDDTRRVADIWFLVFIWLVCGIFVSQYDIFYAFRGKGSGKTLWTRISGI